MLLALSTEGKIGLGVLAGALIVFALLSSFYFPRRNPDFPGTRLGLFIVVASLLFVGTMAGVVFFAKEEEEAHGAEATETHGTETGEAPPTSTETARHARGRCGGRRGRLRLRGLRRLPHARGRRRLRHCRPESRRREARSCARRRPGHERHGRHALVQGAAQREADPGRRRVRGRLDAGVVGGAGEASAEPPGHAARSDAASSVASIAVAIDAPCVLASERASRPGCERRLASPSPGAIPCAAPGEVSERPKERDWKSRTRRKACRGFKSRPLR